MDIHTLAISIGHPGAGFHAYFWDLFAQDTWQFKKNVLISYGLRYDQYRAPSGLGAAAPFVYTQSFRTPKANFSPRLGVSWQVAPTTVVRANMGIFYLQPPTNTWYNPLYNNGGTSSLVASISSSLFLRAGLSSNHHVGHRRLPGHSEHHCDHAEFQKRIHLEWQLAAYPAARQERLSDADVCDDQRAQYPVRAQHEPDQSYWLPCRWKTGLFLGGQRADAPLPAVQQHHAAGCGIELLLQRPPGQPMSIACPKVF